MKTAPRSRLLLIELVCDLLIFALCAVVCVSLLVKARSMSRESTELTQAVYIAQNAAETWKTGRQPADAQDGYDIDVQAGPDDGSPRICAITVSRDGRVIYVLEEVSAP